MTETIDTFCQVEAAIAVLEAMKDTSGPDPRLLSEIERLNDRLRHLEQSKPVFLQLALPVSRIAVAIVDRRAANPVLGGCLP